MKLKIFQSDKGDSMLITNKNANILVDGGMGKSYSDHVAPTLGKLRDKGQLDLVCVSHIDDDHISGIIKMIEDEVDWRVYEYHNSNGTNTKKPGAPRPPVIKEIWHNAFHEYVKDNVSDIEDTLAANASILSVSNNSSDTELGGLSFSVGQAIQLSRRLKPEQLDIPLNKKFKGKLAMFRPRQKAITIGGMKLSIIAPFNEDLNKLRDEWNEWLKANKLQLSNIRKRVNKEVDMLGNAMNDLSYYIALSKVLGNRASVTPPNLASIMFLIEEDNKTLLMTGDGHSDDIRKGLIKIKKLDEKKGLHINALKIQHHGSEHNIDDEFCRLITADHYIFCGNGAHENPEIDVIAAIIKARTSIKKEEKAITSEAGQKFTLWFNSSSKVTKTSYQEHMEKVEKFVKAKARNKPQINYEFMPKNKSFFDLTL